MRPKSASTILKKAKVSAFLVSNLTNIRYLTGMHLSAGIVLIRGSKITLFVDGRYTEAAKKGKRKGVTVKDIGDLEIALKGVRRLGFEEVDVTVSRLKHWKKKFPKIKWVGCQGVIEEFRRSKSPDEMKKFKKAQKITQKIMKKIPKLLKTGVTEKGIAEEIRRMAIDFGADELSFNPIVAFGKNSASPHHHPGSATLKKRDIIQIDCGARVDGYCADQSRVFFLGKPTIEQRRVYEAVETAKRKAEGLLKKNPNHQSQVTNHQLDKIARDTLAEKDLEQYFTHSLGHGVGLDIHEGPSLSEKAKKTKLLKNEIVTIEPGVYIPGKFGIRLEDEVIISGKQLPTQ